ncbi:cysteate synthase [Streptacidiphilus sp. P02-A3a]|uniref:cysteate synthase n=1 Tax=Streptacidiphilus sp. P02-A3a TaxID=2704468 RepID=UPI0015FDB7DC|nr:cysteate synthase [Streptacidiphilus sp. P02-A3a]QMU70587.1 cysteate synthase [Streptacidiphilus sp. P02-A3a]
MHGDSTDASHYRLVCSVCGRRQADDGLTLGCAGQHEPGLWQTDYQATEFVPDASQSGVFRYRDWLPVRRTLEGTGRTVVHRSERLAAELGLDELWIAFNGYWPERGGDLTTGTFKELEAAAVIGRIPADAGTLVVASAGNTAAAFAELCSRYEVPVAIVVPASAVPRLRTRGPRSALVRLIAVEGADYADAIALSDALARLPGFVHEGGTRNVGRRDGLATVLLAAVETMGQLPEYYLQAIGSGAGAIAVHEAALRLRCSRPGPLPQLILAQNDAYAPVYRAWETGERLWESGSEEGQRRATELAFAPELTNRRPPYDLRGGLCEALTESAGDVLVADRGAALAAMASFQELEGIDIEPAAGVALAALRAAVAAGRIDTRASVLLNITGGGRARFARDHVLTTRQPDLTVPRAAVHDPASLAAIAAVAAVPGPLPAMA